MGVFWLVVKLFGSLPAPVILSAFLDYGCLIWKEVCGETGFCWIYNDDLMLFGMLALRKWSFKKTLKYHLKHGSSNPIKFYLLALPTKIVNVILYGLGAYYFVPHIAPSDAPAESDKEEEAKTSL